MRLLEPLCWCACGWYDVIWQILLLCCCCLLPLCNTSQLQISSVHIYVSSAVVWQLPCEAAGFVRSHEMWPNKFFWNTAANSCRCVDVWASFCQETLILSSSQGGLVSFCRECQDQRLKPNINFVFLCIHIINPQSESTDLTKVGKSTLSLALEVQTGECPPTMLTTNKC